MLKFSYMFVLLFFYSPPSHLSTLLIKKSTIELFMSVTYTQFESMHSNNKIKSINKNCLNFKDFINNSY